MVPLSFCRLSTWCKRQAGAIAADENFGMVWNLIILTKDDTSLLIFCYVEILNDGYRLNASGPNSYIRYNIAALMMDNTLLKRLNRNV
ncbi:hypothetical protein D3C80_1816910 [compost metagenome]